MLFRMAFFSPLSGFNSAKVIRLEAISYQQLIDGNEAVRFAVDKSHHRGGGN